MSLFRLDTSRQTKGSKGGGDVLVEVWGEMNAAGILPPIRGLGLKIEIVEKKGGW